MEQRRPGAKQSLQLLNSLIKQVHNTGISLKRAYAENRFH